MPRQASKVKKLLQHQKCNRAITKGSRKKKKAEQSKPGAARKQAQSTRQKADTQAAAKPREDNR